MLKELRQISTSIRDSNPYWDYVIDVYELPNGSTGSYYYVRSAGSAIVIPITTDGHFVLVRQYRYLEQGVSLEFPGGSTNNSDAFRETAIEELKQETGFEPQTIRDIGFFYPCKGVTNELCRVFVATDLVSRTAEPDISEELEIVTMTRQQIEESIERGELHDGMSLAAWLLFLNNNRVK